MEAGESWASLKKKKKEKQSYSFGFSPLKTFSQHRYVLEQAPKTSDLSRTPDKERVMLSLRFRAAGLCWRVDWIPKPVLGLLPGAWCGCKNVS